MSDLLKLQNGSDIRGIALEGVAEEYVNLTLEVCNRIGQAFAQWLAKKTQKDVSSLKIGIGRDSRLSGEALQNSVAEGIASCKASVIDCGLATTPSMFMSTVFEQTKFDGSAMLTASHLPFNRNGIKFFDKDGGLEHDDITDILKIASTLEEKSVNLNNCEKFNLIDLYSEHLKNTIISNVNTKKNDSENNKNNTDILQELKIVVDAGNGAGGFFAEKVLKPLGANTEGSQFLNPDGNFPNHIPNPENSVAMEAIKSAVIKNKADLGLIFDTDVDRMSAVLPDGTEVNRDAIIAMIASILAEEYPNSTIITDSVTSQRLTYFLQDILGLRHLCYMRGYKNVINKCKELNSKGIVSPLAMETSGHGALKDNYYLDDGAFLAVKLVIALANAKKQGKQLASLIEKLPPLVEAKEFRFKILTQDFKSYGKEVLEKLKEKAGKNGYLLPTSYEGVRIAFDDKTVKGWALLRLSLHDPVMPLNIEGERIGDLDKIKDILKQMLFEFDKLDTSCLN